MRAWRFHRFGPYREVLSFDEVPSVTPGEGECRVQVSAAALNFPDSLLIEGKYQLKPELPATPGSEGVGVVVESGPNARFKPGDRVIFGVLTGGFAEELTVPDAFLLPVPPSMTDDQAAGFHFTYQTSYLGLTLRAQLKKGEWVLVHGAAGGVGSAAVQLAHALGAKVIATATGAKKCQVATQCGADHVLDLKAGDFVPQVKALTDGRGVDVVYDPVGGDVFDRSLKVIAREGRLLVIGFTSGTIPQVPVNRLLLKNASVVGFQWGSYKFEQPELITRAHDELCTLFTAGAIAPVISERRFPLSAFPDALDALLSRDVVGKVVLHRT